MLRPIKIAIVVAVLAIAAFDSFYTLSENEMAVLTTFGRPSSVTTSGPKFKVPFIQKVHKMSKEIKGMPIDMTRITTRRTMRTAKTIQFRLRPSQR